MKYHYKISICLDQKTFKNVNIQKHHSPQLSMFWSFFKSEIMIFILRCFWGTVVVELAVEHLRTCGNIIKFVLHIPIMFLDTSNHARRKRNSYMK